MPDELGVDADRCDYADAFELRVAEPDARTAEQWGRLVEERGGVAVLRFARAAQQVVLRFELGPPRSPDHIIGFRIVSAEPEVMRIEASSSLMRAVLVGRRVDACCMRLSTFIFYERPALARPTWAVVAPVHRAVARLLMARTAVRSF